MSTNRTYLPYERVNEAIREVEGHYPAVLYDDQISEALCERVIIRVFCQLYDKECNDPKKWEMSLVKRLEDFNKRFPRIKTSML